MKAPTINLTIESNNFEGTSITMSGDTIKVAGNARELYTMMVFVSAVTARIAEDINNEIEDEAVERESATLQ